MSKSPPGDAKTPEIPDFELLRLIGRGSFGDVWIARTVTGVLRAIKVVWRDQVPREDAYEREFRGLQRFARISLECARQLALLHVGRNDKAGYFYSVMELADDAETGRSIQPDTYVPLTLRELRQRHHHLPAADVIRIGADLASALVELHQKGLIHRDIKPSNVIVVGGVPKLADMGLVAQDGEALTTLFGTPGFVPPAGAGTHQADIYATGKVLYELSSGLDREDYPRLPEDLATRPDRARYFELNEVIERACSQDPIRRFGSAQELWDELNVLLAGQSVLVLRSAARWARRAARSTVVLALLCLVLGWLYWRQTNLQRVQRDRLADSFRQEGIRLANDDNPILAVPWLLHAADMREPASPKVQEDLDQVAAVLHETPHLEILWRYPQHINDLRFAPHRDELAVALESGDIEFWEPTSRRRLRTLAPFDRWADRGVVRQAAQQVRYSRDGRSMLCAGDRGAVLLWDTSAPEASARLFLHTNHVRAAALSADGRLLATACADAILRIWATDDPSRPRGEIPGIPARQVAFAPHRNRLVAGCDDSTAVIFDVEPTLTRANSLPHPYWVYDVEFSPQGELIATACADQNVYLWTEPGGVLERAFPHRAMATGARFTIHGEQLVTVARDGLVHRWNLRRLVGSRAILPHPENAFVAELSPDGDWLAAGGKGGILRVWRIHTASLTWARPHRIPILNADHWTTITPEPDGLAFPPPDSRTAPSATSIPISRILTYESDTSGVGFLGCHRDGTATRVVWRAPDGRVHQHPLPTPCNRVLNTHRRLGRVLYFSETSELILWDAATQALVQRCPVGQARYFGSQTHPGGDWVTLEGSSTVELWNLRDARHRILEPPRTADSSPYFITTSAFSPDSRFLAIAGSTGSDSSCACRVFRVTAEGVAAESLPVSLEHQDGIRGLVFSADGRTLVSVGEDRTAKAWDTQTWKPRVPPMRHIGEVWRAAVSPDGTRLLTASESRPGITDTLCLWDLTTGLPVSPRVRVGLDIRRVGWVPDIGRWAWLGQAPEAAAGDPARITGEWFQPPMTPTGPALVRAKALAQIGFQVNEHGSLTPIPFELQRVSHAETAGPLVLLEPETEPNPQ